MALDVDLKKLKLSIQPQVLAGLLNLDDESGMSFKELDHLIKTDQTMAALILKAANSSLYSRGHEIKTLQTAIGMLGFKVVRSLAMVASSRQLFETGNYTRFKKLVWEHSIVTALIARRLAERNGHKEQTEEAFIAGLLHDIGKIILNVIDRKMFIEAINRATEKKIPFHMAETEVFGTNHLELGAQAAVAWQLPKVYEVILSRHTDVEQAEVESEEERSLLYIVSYANYLAKKYGYGHYTEHDDADGNFLKQALSLSEENQKYFDEELPGTLQNDEYYKFFMTMV